MSMYPQSPPGPPGPPVSMPPPPVGPERPSLPLTVLQSFLIGFALAAASGAVVLGGFTLFGSTTECASQGDGWCMVGWFLIGLVGGLIVATVAYIVSGLLYIHAKVPVGHRTSYVLLHLFSPVVALTLLSAVIAIGDAVQG